MRDVPDRPGRSLRISARKRFGPYCACKRMRSHSAVSRSGMHTSEIERSMVTVPAFADVVPVEAKLRELGVYALKGRFGKRNPNPFANDFGEFKLGRHSAAEFLQYFFNWQGAVEIPFRKIHVRFHGCVLGDGLGLFRCLCRFCLRYLCRFCLCSDQLLGSVLSPSVLLFLCLVLFVCFHGLFFDLCCSVSDSRPSPPKSPRIRAVRGSSLQRAPRVLPPL